MTIKKSIDNIAKSLNSLWLGISDYANKSLFDVSRMREAQNKLNAIASARFCCEFDDIAKHICYARAESNADTYCALAADAIKMLLRGEEESDVICYFESLEARKFARDDFYKSASPPDVEKYCVGGNVGEPLMFAVSFYCPKCKQEVVVGNSICFDCHTRIDWRDVKLESNERWEFKRGVSICTESLAEALDCGEKEIRKEQPPK